MKRCDRIQKHIHRDIGDGQKRFLELLAVRTVRIREHGELAAAAKDAAAQAKSTVEDANNPVTPSIVPSSPSQSAVPLAVAVVLSLLAILLIRQLRRR